MPDPIKPLPPAGTPEWRVRLESLADRTGVAPARLAVGGVIVAVLAAVVLAVAVVRSGGTAASPRPLLPVTSAPARAVGGAAAGATASTGGAAITTASTTTVARPVVVDVAGAVVNPGLRTLPPGSRAADAVSAAGGPAKDADLAAVNLARVLLDGEQLRVPHRGEVLPPPPPTVRGSTATTAATPIDLNTATAAELDDALPGVGPATAQAIVDQRTKVGRFAKVDNLLDVPGIGPAKLERIRPLVRV